MTSKIAALSPRMSLQEKGGPGARRKVASLMDISLPFDSDHGGSTHSTTSSTRRKNALMAPIAGSPSLPSKTHSMDTADLTNSTHSGSFHSRRSPRSPRSPRASKPLRTDDWKPPPPPITSDDDIIPKESISSHSSAALSPHNSSSNHRARASWAPSNGNNMNNSYAKAGKSRIKYIEAISPRQVEKESVGSTTRAARRESAPPSLTNIESTNNSGRGKRASVVERWKNMSEEVPPAFKVICTPRGSKHKVQINPEAFRHQAKSSPIPEPVNRVSPATHQTKFHPSKLKTTWPPIPKTQAVIIREVANVEKGSVKSKRSSFETAGWPKDQLPLLDGLSPKQRNAPLVAAADKKNGHDSSIQGPPSQGGTSATTSHLPQVPLTLDGDDERWDKASGADTGPVRGVRKRTSMRIRWGGECVHSFLNEYFDPKVAKNIDMAEPLIKDRFSNRSKDFHPMRPRRQVSDTWSYDDPEDSDFSYSDSDGEDDAGLADRDPPIHKVKGYNRPDVWITPMDGHDDENDNDDGMSMWRVKRVWDCDPIDEHELEVNVSSAALMNTVKQLLGVAEESKNAVWKIKKIYDIDGVIDYSEKQKRVDEEKMLKGIQVIAGEDDIVWKTTSKETEQDREEEKKDTSKETKQDRKEEKKDTKKKKNGKPSATGDSAKEPSTAVIHNSNNSNLFAYDRSPRKEKKPSKQWKNRTSIGQLLSPPPVMQWHDFPDSD